MIPEALYIVLLKYLPVNKVVCVHVRTVVSEIYCFNWKKKGMMSNSGEVYQFDTFPMAQLDF